MQRRNVETSTSNGVTNSDTTHSANGSSGSTAINGHDGVERTQQDAAEPLQEGSEIPHLRGQETAQLDFANILSIFTYWWVTPLIAFARKHNLRIENIYPMPASLYPKLVLDKFMDIWNHEVQTKGPAKASLVLSLIKTFKVEMIKAVVIVTLFVVAAVIGPVIFLRRLLQFLRDDGDDPIDYGIGMAAGLVLSEFTRSTLIHQYWFRAAVYAVGFRAAVFGLVYKKALELRNLGNYTIGELVNICSNDGQRVFDAGTFSMFIYIASVTGISVIISSSILIGPAALLGCFIFFLTLPLQATFARQTAKLRRQSIAQTDRRVRLMQEILTCIKLIKMYAWERPFARCVNDIRDKEVHFLRHAGYWQSITVSLVPVMPVLATVSTFLLLAYTEDEVTSADVFTVVALFNVLRFSMAVLPMGVKAAAEARIGVKRLRSFLLQDNMREPLPKPKDETIAIALDHATVGWCKTIGIDEATGRSYRTGAETEKTEVVTVLSDVNFTIRHGELVGVCGAVGAGKSSLLMAMLGQTETVGGSIAVSDNIAYVSQQAWIQSATLRDNILFGEPYDEDRYQEVLRACQLAHDLRVLPAGDQTEIGERGINLSGGQKQRISLARAAYCTRPIYLLDDPLSAVDSHVGQAIFDNLIRGLLKDKTVILVTHQLQYLPQCDRVAFISDQTVQVAVHDDLLEQSPDYAYLISHHTGDESDEEDDDVEEHENDTKDDEVSDASKPSGEESSEPQEQATDQAASPQKDAGTLVLAEKMEAGAVSLKTYGDYARAGGGRPIFLFIILLFFVAMAAKTFSDWYLSFWIRRGDGSGEPGGDLRDNPNLDDYALVYGMSAVALLVLQAIRGLLFTRQTLAASTGLHEQLFRRVSRAPMWFFDTTPTGRVLNRFSKDMDEIDVRLPLQLEQFLQNVAQMLLTMGLIAYVFPWFLVALIPIASFFFFLVFYFRPAQRQTKRLDNVSRSPLFSHLTASLQGLPTIHAFGKAEQFHNQYNELLERNSRAFFAFYYASRWFGWRLDMTTTMIITATAILTLALRNEISAQLAALTLTYALSMAGVFQYTTRLSAEVEGRFTSAERISRYIIDTPQERRPPKGDDAQPPKHWPARGSISFKGVSMRYRDKLPLVLKGVDLEIKPKEKIGIVGRTGSGKSSLAVCLFRLVELAEGTISIDGVNIAELDLEALRSRLSVIPQDPVLFVGTIRYNLDPFDQYDDATIWSALERAHVKAAIEKLDQGLEAPVVENGENFSVGERQLLCMARAILRRSTILIMDEATAAIDTQTDALIQQTIRQEFAECTVLTIAHRLNTILDSDRILVMDNGSVAEFDTPVALASNASTQFSDMLASTGVSSRRVSRMFSLRPSQLEKTARFRKYQECIV